MTRVSKYLVLLSALIVIAGGFILSVAEVRYAVGYQLSPERTRNAGFAKYTAPSGTTVYHLGTIHGRHLETQAFGLGHLQAVIEQLRPTLVMVEVLPEEIVAGNPASGPLEMPVATLISQRAGTRVAGIDWWNEDFLEGRSPHDRDDKMFENLIDQLPSRGRVLVLTGFSHQLEFRSRYTASGFTQAHFSDAEKNALFAEVPDAFRFPDGTDEAISRAIAWAEGRRDGTTQRVARESYEGKIRSLEEFRARLNDPEIPTIEHASSR